MLQESTQTKGDCQCSAILLDKPWLSKSLVWHLDEQMKFLKLKCQIQKWSQFSWLIKHLSLQPRKRSMKLRLNRLKLSCSKRVLLTNLLKPAQNLLDNQNKRIWRIWFQKFKRQELYLLNLKKKKKKWNG